MSNGGLNTAQIKALSDHMKEANILSGDIKTWSFGWPDRIQHEMTFCWDNHWSVVAHHEGNINDQRPKHVAAQFRLCPRTI
jgi:hypothetical protein